MFIFTLRIIGKKFDAKAFQRKTRWKVNSLWQKGKFDKLRKKISKDSGLNYDVWECSEPTLKATNNKLLKFFTRYEAVLKTTQGKADRFLDVGYIAPDKERFVTGIQLSKAVLDKLAKTSTDFAISIYCRSKRKRLKRH